MPNSTCSATAQSIKEAPRFRIAAADPNGRPIPKLEKVPRHSRSVERLTDPQLTAWLRLEKIEPSPGGDHREKLLLAR